MQFRKIWNIVDMSKFDTSQIRHARRECKSLKKKWKTNYYN